MALRNLLLAAAIFLVGTARGLAADFDGDGVADEFTVTHEADKVAKQAGVQLANPWKEVRKSTKSPKGLGLVIRLSRPSQKFLVHDAQFFSSPMGRRALHPRDHEKRSALQDLEKECPGHEKRRGPALHEAGIDILLYWDGRWRLFWPDEEP